MKIVIFIDDVRKPEKYVNTNLNKVVCAATYDEFVVVLNKLFNKYKHIDEIWFDHDLGDHSGTGLECAKYLVEFCMNNDMQLPEYHIQSANVVGKQNIDSYLKSYLKSLSL